MMIAFVLENRVGENSELELENVGRDSCTARYCIVVVRSADLAQEARIVAAADSLAQTTVFVGSVI